ncbi:hypothetical protein T10_6924 [Trichinella papuae]|uniref:Uncharacterized protein n=1 Tax=Trichinella papuae TaxID=268474 RepID=A0A0V1MLF4_9BILA|nr:hypothetical protein T10_6924 [Trichinella papuae]
MKICICKRCQLQCTLKYTYHNIPIQWYLVLRNSIIAYIVKLLAFLKKLLPAYRNESRHTQNTVLEPLIYYQKEIKLEMLLEYKIILVFRLDAYRLC